jgi:hypothetical protein
MWKVAFAFKKIVFRNKNLINGEFIGNDSEKAVNDKKHS